MKEPQHNSSQAKHKDPMPLLAAGIVILLVGIIAVSWFFVEILQENSKNMRKYKVKPDILRNSSSGMNLFSEVLQTVDERERKHPVALQLYEDGCRKIGAKDYQAAIIDLERSLQHCEIDRKSESFSTQDNKDLASVHYQLARCYFSMGRLQKSVDELSLAIKNNPNNRGYYQDRADLYHLLHRPDLAAADFKAAEAIDLPGASYFTEPFLKGQQLDH